MMLVMFGAAQETQTSTTTPRFGNLPVPAWGQGISSPSRAVHPMIGGVASGAGSGSASGRPTSLAGTRRRGVGTVDLLSLHENWAADVQPPQLGAFGTVRHMAGFDYFGSAAQRVRRSLAFGCAVHIRHSWMVPARTPAVQVVGSIAAYMPNLGTGEAGRFGLGGGLYTPSVPGFDAEPTLAKGSGLWVPCNHARAQASSTSQTLSGTRIKWRDEPCAISTGQTQFHRWERSAAAHSRIPGDQSLTLHGFLAYTNNGADVPVLYVVSARGSGGLKTVARTAGGDGPRIAEGSAIPVP